MAFPYLYLPYGAGGTSGYITSVTPSGFTEDRVVDIQTSTWNATMANFWIKFDSNPFTFSNQSIFLYRRSTTLDYEHRIILLGNSSQEPSSIQIQHQAILQNGISGSYYRYRVLVNVSISQLNLDLTEWNNFHIPWIPASHLGQNPVLQDPPSHLQLTSGSFCWVNGTVLASNAVQISDLNASLISGPAQLQTPQSGQDMQFGNPNLSTNVRIAHFWLRPGSNTVGGDDFYSSSGPGGVTYGTDGAIGGQTPTIYLPFNNNFEDASTSITPNWKFTASNNAAEGELIDDVVVNLNSTFDFDLGILFPVDASANLSSITRMFGNEFFDVEDYVETDLSILYVDDGYYNTGYAKADPYVDLGYIEDIKNISATVIRSSTIEEISSNTDLTSVGGNAISAELDVTGSGAITVTAKATLASEVDLTANTDISVAGSLLFDVSQELAADSQTQTAAGLIFDQAVELDTDVALTATGGSIINAELSADSNTEFSADVDVNIGTITELSTRSEVEAIGGYIVNDIQTNFTTQAQLESDATVLAAPEAIFLSETQISADAGLDISAELDVTGSGAITVTARATTGSDVELNGNFQFSAIANVTNSATAELDSNTDIELLAGLSFSEIVGLDSDLQISATGKLNISAEQELNSDFQSSQTVTVLVGGIGNFESQFTFDDVEPSLTVGGISNIFQSTSIVVVEGTYLYDIPLIRRLTVPRDLRTGNILQETRILNVKSESRINTVISETRNLTVPKNSRTLKIYDGSL